MINSFRFATIPTEIIFSYAPSFKIFFTRQYPINNFKLENLNSLCVAVELPGMSFTAFRPYLRCAWK